MRALGAALMTAVLALGPFRGSAAAHALSPALLEIEELAGERVAVAWKISVTNPMPLTLAFTGKVSGDSMSGEMGIGPMGSFPFTGTRA